MGVFSTFEISAAGMNLQRLRLDVAAVNLANAHTARAADGTAFKPLRVSLRAAPAAHFDIALDAARGDLRRLVPGDAVVETVDRPPRTVYEPGHPDADAKGFVSYPDINPVAEMVDLIAINRAYEANVRALNMAKSMALKALEIGGDR